MEQLSTLRATAQRLNATPVEDLPRIAGFLASSISSCSILRDESTKGVDFSGTLHKLRVRLSSLLQDRNPAGRLTAAVVIKAFVETVRPVESGQWEAWARGLITCLNKPDPWSLKQLYLATVTRIFVLCRDSPTLQREVVSPLLPTFLSTGLAALKPSTVKHASHSQLLQSALMCWSELLKDYSQTFRPFVTRIKQICTGLLSDIATSSVLRDQATRALCALHLCAPKATALSDWNQTASNIVVATHETLDLLLRAVIEDWRSSNTAFAERNVKQYYQKPPELSQLDSAGLGPWKGLFEAAERVAVLLRWLRCTLEGQSQASELPTGDIIDLLTRITSVTVPSSGNQTRTSSEVSRDEREELWSHMPRLHVECLQLLVQITDTLGLASVPMVNLFCRMTTELHEAEGWNESLRACCYRSIAQFLRISGNALDDIPADDLSSLVRACCGDLLRFIETTPRGQSAASRGSDSKAASMLSTSTALKTPTKSHYRHSQHPSDSAEDLMVSFYMYYPTSLLPHSLRTEFDRTAILCNSKRAITASVMNPPKSSSGSRAQPSLLPFLAQRASNDDLEIDMLLRPRMPTIGGISYHTSRDESDVMQGLEMDGNDVEPASPSMETTLPNHMNTEGFTAQPLTSHDVSPQQEEGDQVETRKRAFGHMLQSTLTLPAETLNGTTSHKKPRLGDPIASVDTASFQPAPSTADEQHHAALSAHAAGDEIVMHGTSNHTAIAAAADGDSDDDSDIPEIDPELATDEEEEDDR